MNLDEYKEGASFYTTKKGNRLLIQLAKEAIEITPFIPVEANKEIAKSFIKSIENNPEIIQKIKGAQSLHSDGLTNTLHFLASAHIIDIMNYSEDELKEARKKSPRFFEAMERVAKFNDAMDKEAHKIGKEFGLEHEQVGYLFQYMINKEVISGNVNIKIGKKFNDDEHFYIRVHKNTSAKEINTAWTIAREYFKEAGMGSKRKNYPAFDSYHEHIYQDSLKGMTANELADKYNKEPEYINKLLKRFKKRIPDKIK